MNIDFFFQVVDDAVTVLDPGHPGPGGENIELKENTPENDAKLIDDLMETEMILNKGAGNLSTAEKNAIEVNLEEKVVNEIR